MKRQLILKKSYLKPFQEAFFIGSAFNKPPKTLKLFRKAACDPEHCSENILATVLVPHITILQKPTKCEIPIFLQIGDSGDRNLKVKKLFVNKRLLFTQGGHSVRADGTPRVQKRLHHSQKVRTKSRT
jgi:hypothetical protein